jgi:hypothetical protein
MPIGTGQSNRCASHSSARLNANNGIRRRTRRHPLSVEWF